MVRSMPAPGALGRVSACDRGAPLAILESLSGLRADEP